MCLSLYWALCRIVVASVNTDYVLRTEFSIHMFKTMVNETPIAWEWAIMK